MLCALRERRIVNMCAFIRVKFTFPTLLLPYHDFPLPCLFSPVRRLGEKKNKPGKNSLRKSVLEVTYYFISVTRASASEIVFPSRLMDLLAYHKRIFFKKNHCAKTGGRGAAWNG